MEARYLRVKNWADFQHYKDKEPGWIKLYTKLLRQNDFVELGEAAQWQLVRIWLYASQASRHVLDEDGRKVPVVPNDEKTLRVGIGTLKRIPLAQFIRGGWLIPTASDELLGEASESRPGLDEDYASSSSLANGRASDRASAHSINRGLEKKEKTPRAVTPTNYAQPSIGEIIDLSLKESA